MNELLSKHNQKEAFEHLKTKKEGYGNDKMLLSEFPAYWELNHIRIEEELRTCRYQPGVVKSYEIINGKGKRREISSLNVIDRFITRLLSQKLRCYLEPEFLEHSYAYQEGKGILDAVKQAQTYMEEGNTVVVEIDIKNYFDTIPLEGLMYLIREKITDEAVIYLIRSYLYCKVVLSDNVINKERGIIQGNSISPILSNLYLHALDWYMEERGYYWIRFADNINIYTRNQEEAGRIYKDIIKEIRLTFKLEINEKKSGIYDGFTRGFLGYDFFKASGKVEVRKHRYQKTATYHNWHPCVVQRVNHEYHIVQNGVLNKQDYAILFENDKEKHHIPVEVVDQMNMYGEVTITSNVLKTFSDKNIRIAFLDKYGSLMGHYVPEGYEKSSFAVLEQCSIYNDNNQRLQLARQIEIAGIHNMRANIRYYNKKQKNDLQNCNAALSQYIVEVNEAVTIDDLLLIEEGQEYTYKQLIEREIWNFQKYILKSLRYMKKNRLE